MNSNELKNDKINNDKLFIGHISNVLCTELHGRMSYLGFLVTINIASFAGLNLLTNKGQSIWQFSFQKTALLFILIFVNLIFTIMYLREHNITRIRDQGLRIALGENVEITATSTFARDLKSDDNLRGITWWATKLLLAVFNAIPISFSMIIICKEYMLGNLKIIYGTNLLFCVLVIFIIIFVYSYLSLKTHTRDYQDEGFINQVKRLYPWYKNKPE